MTEQASTTIVESSGPEKARYIERMSEKIKQGMRYANFFVNYEGLAEKYGGTPLYQEVAGLPPILANGVEFPDQETHNRAWESVYAEINRALDEVEAGNTKPLEFGDSTDPNYEYHTDEGKVKHVLHMRSIAERTGQPELKSRWEQEVLDRGLLPVKVDSIDNWNPSKTA